MIDLSQNSTQLGIQIPAFLILRVIGEGVSFVESKDDERLSWASVRIQQFVFVYEAAERCACFCHASAILQNVPAKKRFFSVATKFAHFQELEKTVILAKTGKDKKFTLLAISVTFL
jgi:hypothetical protein